MDATLEQQLRQMVPPKTMKQAQELATFGDAAVTYLMPKEEWTAGTMAACVRTLASIGSSLALAVLEEYAADGRKPVVEELEQAWNAFDREEYARRVLAVTYRDRTHLELKDPPSLDGIQHFHHLRSLRVAWRRSDIGPLAGLTQLEDLDLSESPYLHDLAPFKSLVNLHSLKLRLLSDSDLLKPLPYDLEPLGHLTRLTTLQLSGRLDRCDFSFLTRLHHLSELDICGPGEAILSHIRNLAGLRTLCIASSAPVHSLDPLSHLTDLTSLALADGWWVSNEELGTRTINLSPLAHLVNLVELSLPNQLTPTDLSFLQGLEQLEHLFLGNCMQLEDFSPLAHLPRLSSLEVRGYRGEDCRLCGLTALTSLSLAEMRAETLVLADLPRLHKLHVEKGGLLSSVAIHSLIIERVPALPELTLSSWNLRWLTCADMSALSFLTINEAVHLHTLTLHHVPRLARARMYDVHTLQTIRVTGETQLTDLSLSAPHLSSLPQFEGLTRLEKLWIWAPQPLHDLSPLQQLPQLRELALHGLREIDDFTPLTTLPHLEDLHLEGCSTRATLLTHLPALTTLMLKYLVPQKTFTLEDLPCLRVLKIDNLRQHQFKLLFANVPALQSLRVEACTISNRQGASGLFWDALPALTELNIDGFGGLIDNIESLRTLQALEKLEFHRCHGLANLEPLAELHALKNLAFFACSRLNDLTPLGRLSQLDSLEFISCEAIDNLTPLASLSQLTTLSLYELENLLDLSPIADLHHLTSLTLGKSQQLHDFSAIAQLTALQELRFTRCTIEDLSILHALPALRKLTLFECQAVRSLQPLLALPHLEELEVFRMRQVEVPPELKKRVNVRRQ